MRFATILFESICENQPELVNEDSQLTKQQLDDIEDFANSLFNKLGIKFDWSQHFWRDRVNDARNGIQITVGELQRMINLQFQRNGPLFKKNRFEQEGVWIDTRNNINIPVAFKRDPSGKFEMLIRAQTVMRKKGFRVKPGDKMYSVF